MHETMTMDVAQGTGELNAEREHFDQGQPSPRLQLRRERARLVVDERTRQLAYTLAPAGARGEIAGVYLHRRANRPNGGVAQILTKRLDGRMSGSVTLLDAELADLKAGKCYIAAVSRQSPLIAARADLVWPARV